MVRFKKLDIEEPLKDIVIDEHTLSRESYNGTQVTSSYFDLKFRFIPDSNLKTITNQIHPSQHPNQQITGSQNGSHLKNRCLTFREWWFDWCYRKYYTKVPSAEQITFLTIKLEQKNPLKGILNTDNKVEKSQYDSRSWFKCIGSLLSHKHRMYNEDIYNHVRYFDIDDYIGNPDNELELYRTKRRIRLCSWKKYLKSIVQRI